MKWVLGGLVVILLLIVVGVLYIRWEDNRLTIEVDTGRIEQGAERTVDQTKPWSLSTWPGYPAT